MKPVVYCVYIIYTMCLLHHTSSIQLGSYLQMTHVAKCMNDRSAVKKFR